MTEFDKCDTNGNGVIDRHEWDAIDLEDRRRKMEDDDKQRDQQRKMVWFALWGMLLYPITVILASLIEMNTAAKLVADMSSVYFLSVGAIVGVFFGVDKLQSPKADKK